MKNTKTKKAASVSATLEDTGNVTYKTTQAIRKALASIALNQAETTADRLAAATLYLESLGIVGPPMQVLV